MATVMAVRTKGPVAPDESGWRDGKRYLWPLGLLVPALTLNGVCIACFLVTGQLYVNRQARPDVRASAQGLFTFINGVGLLFGHIGVGWVRQSFAPALPQAFVPAAILAVGLVVLFAFGFAGPSQRAREPPP